MNIKFGRGNSLSDKPRDDFFYVNNCGIYKNLSHKVNVCRPNGRNDYQIIYVTDGHLIIETKSGQKKVKKGNIIVFEPKVKQHYYTDDTVLTGYNWIHFTGTKAKEIMDMANLKTGIYSIDDFDIFSSKCCEIIEEMQKNDKICNIKISGTAISLIGEISKKLYSTNIPDKFTDVIARMENDKANGTKIEEYASMCNLSTGHFIKLFKEKYGITPANYRLKLLIDKSRILLIDSDLKISDIADKCGFDDALYFSRIFKKTIGLSPENYRKKHR